MTACVLVEGNLAYMLVLLVIVVGWEALAIRAHTQFQALAGTALAVSVTVGIFWLLGF